MKPADIDKLISDIRTAIYAEQSHRKIIEIDPDIYRRVRLALSDLQAEAAEYFQNQDIENYLTVNNRIQTIKRDFKSLFQRRFEKIVAKAIYDIGGETLSPLTEEEREFIEKIHNIIMEEFESFIPKREEHKEEKAQTVVIPEKEAEDSERAEIAKEEIVQEKKSSEEAIETPTPSATEDKNEEKRYILVMITEDLPPIAQSDRNYSLHNNDLVHIPSDLATILIKRNAAIPLEKMDQ
ncbi:DNA replication complex GINS family protein [Thermoplasma sp.]|uniref:DNA replication complex GINS family protein n=1 Tax=Thermoplasma sp. TaxID=1973142 RepID=UPI00261D0FFA|nr:DNA replication complex GINS family protein [Thermoplasma sp.]